jgi:hypothetical protein
LAGVPGAGDIEKHKFPGLDVEKAFGIFTKAAYGRKINPDHA